MDEFDEIHQRLRTARFENGIAVRSHNEETIAIAKERYNELLEEYHEIYQKHIERVRVKKWMERYESSRLSENPQTGMG